MLTNGRVVFGQMEEVRFGVPAAEAVAEQVARMGAERVFLMVSGTLNRDHRRDRQGPPRARQPVRRRVRPDAAAHAAPGGHRGRGAGARG